MDIRYIKEFLPDEVIYTEDMDFKSIRKIEGGFCVLELTQEEERFLKTEIQHNVWIELKTWPNYCYIDAYFHIFSNNRTFLFIIDSPLIFFLRKYLWLSVCGKQKNEYADKILINGLEIELGNWLAINLIQKIYKSLSQARCFLNEFEFSSDQKLERKQKIINGAIGGGIIGILLIMFLGLLSTKIEIFIFLLIAGCAGVFGGCIGAYSMFNVQNGNPRNLCMLYNLRASKICLAGGVPQIKEDMNERLLLRKLKNNTFSEKTVLTEKEFQFLLLHQEEYKPSIHLGGLSKTNANTYFEILAEAKQNEKKCHIILLDYSHKILFYKKYLLYLIYEYAFTGGRMSMDGRLYVRDEGKYEISNDYTLTPEGKMLISMLNRLYE